MAAQASRHRRWCFTLNNYDDADEVRLKALPDWVEYCIYGHEKAPTTGTLHLQGYLELYNPCAMARIKTYVGKTAHLEPCKGTQEENIKYCSKGENIVTVGTLRVKKQGARSDIASVRKMVLEGASMVDIIMTATSYQSIRTAEKLKQYIEPRRNWNPKIIWIHGPPGFGKSHMAFEMAPDAYAAGDTGKWWQGYDGHEAVIIDNFTDQWAPLQFMLRLLDKYPFTVECKGGSRSFIARTIIITSVHPPQNCYRGEREFQRRIEQYGQVIYLGTPWQDRMPLDHLPSVKGKEHVKDAPVPAGPVAFEEEELDSDVDIEEEVVEGWTSSDEEKEAEAGPA